MTKFKLYIFVVLGILLFVAGAVVSIMVVKQRPQVLGLSAQSEITSLISQVGKLIILPTDELPTVTTISDASKMSGQPFFKNTKNGDKLLVYTNAKWAVLYRPSENRIIEVGAFDAATLPSATPTAVPTATPAPTPTVSPTASASASPTAIPSSSPVSSPAAK